MVAFICCVRAFGENLPTSIFLHQHPYSNFSQQQTRNLAAVQWYRFVVLGIVLGGKGEARSCRMKPQYAKVTINHQSWLDTSPQSSRNHPPGLFLPVTFPHCVACSLHMLSKQRMKLIVEEMMKIWLFKNCPWCSRALEKCVLLELLLSLQYCNVTQY